MRTCVVGAGIIGSWTALHLAEAGAETTLVDQFPLPHDRGSSHGASRAFRFLGDEPLDRLEYSLDRWRDLERLSGTQLFRKTGLLNFGPPGDAYLERFMAVLDRAGRPCQWLDGTTIAKRFPMLRYPAEWGAAWDPWGGVLFADQCLAAVRSRFEALGGHVVTATVESLRADSHGVGVGMAGAETPGAERFDRVVACPGPWTATLLPGLAPHLKSLWIPVTYWGDPDGAHAAGNGFPVLFNARLTGVYGLPACEPHGHVKVLYHGGPETAPDGGDRRLLEPYVARVRRYVKQHLPLLDHEQPALLETCRYTMTPDHEPVLDRIANNLVVGCGFSGSGFKHAPASGRALAALALNREDELPQGFCTERYSLSRFGG